MNHLYRSGTVRGFSRCSAQFATALLAGVFITFGAAAAGAGIGVPDTGMVTLSMPLDNFRPALKRARLEVEFYRGDRKMFTVYRPEGYRDLAIRISQLSYMPARNDLSWLRHQDSRRDRPANLAYGYPSHAPDGSPPPRRKTPLAARPRRAAPATSTARPARGRPQLRRRYLALLARYGAISDRREARRAHRELSALYALLTHPERR